MGFADDLSKKTSTREEILDRELSSVLNWKENIMNLFKNECGRAASMGNRNISYKGHSFSADEKYQELNLDKALNKLCLEIKSALEQENFKKIKVYVQPKYTTVWQKTLFGGKKLVNKVWYKDIMIEARW